MRRSIILTPNRESECKIASQNGGILPEGPHREQLMHDGSVPGVRRGRGARRGSSTNDKAVKRLDGYKSLDKMSDIVFPEEKYEFSFVRALTTGMFQVRYTGLGQEFEQRTDERKQDGNLEPDQPGELSRHLLIEGVNAAVGYVDAAVGCVNSTGQFVPEAVRLLV